MLSAIIIVFRAVQILSAIVVLGLSAKFLQAQRVGSPPMTTIYSVFTGILTLIIGLFGLAALFLDSIPALLATAGDALAAALLVAGGISWAVAMKGAACLERDVRRLYRNPLLNQGCHRDQSVEGMPICGVLEDAGPSPEAWWSGTVLPICERAYVNVGVLFLGFVASLGLVGLGFLMRRKNEMKAHASP